MNFSLPLLFLTGICICALLDVSGVSLLKKRFEPKIGLIMKKPNRVAGVIVWVLMTWGILIFVIPSVLVTDLGDAAGLGAVRGLIVYGIYECTNMALLKHRDRDIVFADICRGMLLCTILSCVLRYMATTMWLFVM